MHAQDIEELKGTDEERAPDDQIMSPRAEPAPEAEEKVQVDQAETLMAQLVEDENNA